MNKHDFLTQPHSFTRAPRESSAPLPHENDARADRNDKLVGIGMAFIFGLLAGMAVVGAL